MKPLTSYPSYVTYFSSFQPIFFHIFGHYGPLNTGNPEPRSYGIKHDLCGKVISRFITWNLKPALQWNCFLSNVLHHFLLLSMGKHQLRRKLRVLLLSFLANWPTCIKLYFHQNPTVCKFDLHIYIPGCQQVGDWGWGIFTHFWKGDILIFASPPPLTHTLCYRTLPEILGMCLIPYLAIIVADSIKSNSTHHLESKVFQGPLEVPGTCPASASRFNHFGEPVGTLVSLPSYKLSFLWGAKQNLQSQQKWASEPVAQPKVVVWMGKQLSTIHPDPPAEEQTLTSHPSI